MIERHLVNGLKKKKISLALFKNSRYNRKCREKR